MYSQTDVRSAVRSAIENMTQGSSGFYAPLVERFPLVVGEENIPPAVLRNLKAHSAPACTDGTNVYVDVAEMLNTITLASEKRKKDGFSSILRLTEEVQNILAHEYTHILCQHTRQGQQFNRDHKGKNIKIFSTACEVEANRGYLVSKYAGVYDIAVTEETFPEVKTDKFLPQIYETLKKKYGNSINQQKNQAYVFAEEQGEGEGDGVPDKENQPSDATEGSTQGEKGESSNGDQSNGQDGSDGQSEPQNDNNQSEGNDGTQGTPTEEDYSEDGGKSPSQGNNPKDSEDELGDEELSSDQQSVVQRMLQTDMDIAEERMTAEDLLPHDESQDVDDDILLSLGLGGGDDGFLELSPAGKLEYIHKRWKANNVAKELAKVKGVIAGTVARDRVRTYSRQSRKQGEDGLMMKGQKRASRSLPKILLAMDSSGSMNGATMKQIASAIADIFETCGRPTEGCFICKHTHNVSQVLPMKRWKEVAESFYPSGGNDFSMVMKKALELDVDVVLNVGDGQDYCVRDSETTKQAVAKGLRWYDCNVVRNGYRRWRSLVNDEKQFSSREGVTIMKRHFIDLTGEHPVNEKGVK